MADDDTAPEQLFRLKYGEILAALLRYAGYDQFELAEEAVQLAFQRAIERWPAGGTPANPSGWLFAVARNALLEAWRRQRIESQKVEHLAAEAAGAPASPGPRHASRVRRHGHAR